MPSQGLYLLCVIDLGEMEGAKFSFCEVSEKGGLFGRHPVTCYGTKYELCTPRTAAQRPQNIESGRPLSLLGRACRRRLLCLCCCCSLCCCGCSCCGSSSRCGCCCCNLKGQKACNSHTAHVGCVVFIPPFRKKVDKLISRNYRATRQAVYKGAVGCWRRRGIDCLSSLSLSPPSF